MLEILSVSAKTPPDEFFFFSFFWVCVKLMYMYFLVCFLQFSDIGIIIISMFSRTEKPSISVTSLKPHSSPNPTPPLTRYGYFPCKYCVEMGNSSFGFFRNLSESLFLIVFLAIMRSGTHHGLASSTSPSTMALSKHANKLKSSP